MCNKAPPLYNLQDCKLLIEVSLTFLQFDLPHCYQLYEVNIAVTWNRLQANFIFTEWLNGHNRFLPVVLPECMCPVISENSGTSSSY